MAKEIYYYFSSNSPYSRHVNTIEFLSKKVAITVDENWERAPSIEVDIGDGIPQDLPEQNQYVKVKKIIPELFDSYYNDTIRHFSNNFPDKPEYYLEASSHTFKIECYTDKEQLSIFIDKTPNRFTCRISLSPGTSGRHYARRKYELLAEEVVKQIFQLTLEFLHNRKSLQNLKDEYFKQIALLVKEDKPISGLILNADLAFDGIRQQILYRIDELENRLINFDEEPNKRLELRGELKGMKFCLKILDANR